LAQVLNSMTAQTRSFVGTLEENVATRTAQLRATAEVGRVAASILDPKRLMHEIVNLISDRFRFYYVAIFTLDEHGQFAVLREASGEAGHLLKERGHRLEVGGHSMVGYTTAQRKLRIALDVGQEAVRFANPLLPETRSEIALPLIVGEQVLGALDVQSTQEAAFDEASAAALQAMSDQIAIALNNASSYTNTQAEALRAHALHVASQHVSRLETNLSTMIEEMMRAVGDTLGFSQWWVVMFDERREWLMPLASTGKGPHKSIRAADQPDSPVIRSAIYGETHVINDPEHDPRMNNIPADRRAMVKFLSVPLVSRGMPIGALTFGHAIDLPDLTPRDLEIGKSLASLCVIAIENRNLFEQTRRALDEVDAVNRLLTGEAWAAFSRRLAKSGAIWIDSSGRSEQRHYPEIGEALSTGKIVVRRAAELGAVDVAVPVLLRGAPIGALRLAIAEHHWTSELAATLESIASHVAQAAENARLVETAETRARRERALSESTDKIRRKADLERVLQTAAEELARHMNASRVAVHLNVEDDAGTGGNGRTG
jgi:GAF domain-containing protein